MKNHTTLSMTYVFLQHGKVTIISPTGVHVEGIKDPDAFLKECAWLARECLCRGIFTTWDDHKTRTSAIVVAQ